MAAGTSHPSTFKPQDSVLNKLVDSERPCSAVYSLFRHENLGYLIGAFMVEHTAGGTLSLRYQRLLPENVSQFHHVLDAADRELVDVLQEVTLNHLFKHFGGSLTLANFLKKFSRPPHQEALAQYVQQRLLRALPLLKGKPLFRMGKDGYPAFKPLVIQSEPARLRFKFRRTSEATEYSLACDLAGRPLMLHTQAGTVLTDEPAWLLSGDTVFTTATPVDGRKLNPFFNKPTITIAREFEASYFEKFLVKLIEQQEVEAEGIEVSTVGLKPSFKLEVRRVHGEEALTASPKDARVPERYTFKLWVVYGDRQYRPADGHSASVEAVKSEQGEWSFRKVLRDVAREQEAADVFAALRQSGGAQAPATLFDFELEGAQAFAWLVANQAHLQRHGIVVEHAYEGPRLASFAPSLRLDVRPQPKDGFRILPHLSLGTFQLPFGLLRTAVLQNQQLLRLPEHGLVYLPSSWHDGLRHLLEVADYRDDVLHVPGSYRSLLRQTVEQFSSAESDVTAADRASLMASLDGPLAELGRVEPTTLPPGLNATLRDYQQAGFDWLCFLQRLGMGGILADDMGLGKTLQALALLLHEKDKGITEPSLIVVPNSLIFNWISEAKKFAPALKLQVYGGTKRRRSTTSLFVYDALITTYGMVRQDLSQFAQQRFHYIILDESQYIKNRDAKTTRAVLSLQADHRLSLTGTPIENSTLDLWTQMHFLNPGLLGSEAFFERFYAQPIEREHNESRAEKLRRLVRPFILRRTKDQVATELPPLIEQVIACEMTPSQEEFYELTRSQFRSSLFGEAAPVVAEVSSVAEANAQTAALPPRPASLLPAAANNKLQILSCLQRLRQIAIHPQMVHLSSDTTPGATQPPADGAFDSGKYDAVWAALRDIFLSGRKVIVFSQFVRFLSILRRDLDKQGITYSYLDGATSDRGAEVERFQTDPSTKVFLLSLKAGGVGLNLTAAEYVLMVDPWWNPAVERQAMFRAHRIGQDKTVVVYKFITQGSIEEKILELQERKSRLADDLIRTDDDFFKSLSRDDLRALFD
jgi:superfamily II DNA or RNA helicase